MPADSFKLLERFLALPEGEVFGRCATLGESLKIRLRQCASGALPARDRAALCGEIKDHREALAFLAREIQSVAVGRPQKKQPHVQPTNKSAA